MNSQAVQGSVVNSWATLNLPTSQRTWWLRRRPAGGKLGEFTKGFLEVLEKCVGSDFWGQERDSNIFLKMECLSDFQLESMYFYAILQRIWAAKVEDRTSFHLANLNYQCLVDYQPEIIGHSSLWFLRLTPTGNHPITILSGGWDHDIHHYENYGCSPMFLETCPKKFQQTCMYYIPHICVTYNIYCITTSQPYLTTMSP